MKKTVCLCMIVKNEAPIITKCFDSFIKYIDYWVICDTGSTDGTQKTIKEYFSQKKIKGELHEDLWVNFAHNRTLAFQKSRGKADYIFVIDADDCLVGPLTLPPGDDFKQLNFKIKLGTLEYYRPQCFNGALEWKYVGVVHEYATLASEPARTYKTGVVQQSFIQAGTFGNRSSQPGNKFERDIVLLKQGLEDEPNNSRYVFYLAQSYKDLGDNTESIKWYQKRASQGGWEEEVYLSLYSVGVCKQRLGRDFEKEVLYDYLRAFNYRKTRLEALYQIVYYYRQKKNYREAFAYGLMGYKQPYPTDTLFVEKDIHDYKFLDEFTIAAYWEKFYQLAYDETSKLILNRDYPRHYLDRLSSNIKFSRQNLDLPPKEGVVFFSYDIDNTEASGRTLRTLHDKLLGHSPHSITNDPLEVLNKTPKIIIAQRHAIQKALQIKAVLGCTLIVLSYGPQQLTLCTKTNTDLCIYNSQHLLDLEKSDIPAQVLYPFIAPDRKPYAPEHREYITFLGPKGIAGGGG